MVRTLLEDLPGVFAETSITDSALGAAIQVAEKLLVSDKLLTLGVHAHEGYCSRPVCLCLSVR